MNRSLFPERRAALLIERMTLDEKITMLHGVAPIPIKGYVGYVPPNARLGIPALRLADGRAGVGNGAKDVTLMPAPIASAASWDRALMNSFGNFWATKNGAGDKRRASAFHRCDPRSAMGPEL
jgi:beta-glucosidase